jgi:competence protein ComGC
MYTAGKRKTLSFSFKKLKGITLIELLIAIAILMIIVVISIINFNSANKLSELRTATDELADDFRNLQVFAFSNIKEEENPAGYEAYPYELGYRYFFDKINNSNIIEYYEILSDSPEVINTGNYVYYPLDNKTLSENHNIIAIETADGQGTVTPYDNYNLAYLFPEAEISFFESDITSQDSAGELIIYIKHDEVADWQGKVTINQYSGRITSEVIEYNP